MRKNWGKDGLVEGAEKKSCWREDLWSVKRSAAAGRRNQYSTSGRRHLAIETTSRTEYYTPYRIAAQSKKSRCLSKSFFLSSIIQHTGGRKNNFLFLPCNSIYVEYKDSYPTFPPFGFSYPFFYIIPSSQFVIKYLATTQYPVDIQGSQPGKSLARWPMTFGIQKERCWEARRHLLLGSGCDSDCPKRTGKISGRSLYSASSWHSVRSSDLLRAWTARADFPRWKRSIIVPQVRRLSLVGAAKSFFQIGQLKLTISRCTIGIRIFLIPLPTFVGVLFLEQGSLTPPPNQ